MSSPPQTAPRTRDKTHWAWSSDRRDLTGVEGVVEIESEWTARCAEHMRWRGYSRSPAQAELGRGTPHPAVWTSRVFRVGHPPGGSAAGAWIGGGLGALAGNALGNILCSRGGGPSFGGNQRQNKQANDAKNEAERRTGKKFTPALERMFHDEITGMNYSYKDLVQIAVDILEMHG